MVQTLQISLQVYFLLGRTFWGFTHPFLLLWQDCQRSSWQARAGHGYIVLARWPGVLVTKTIWNNQMHLTDAFEKSLWVSVCILSHKNCFENVVHCLLEVTVNPGHLTPYQNDWTSSWACSTSWRIAVWIAVTAGVICSLFMENSWFTGVTRRFLT